MLFQNTLERPHRRLREPPLQLSIRPLPSVKRVQRPNRGVDTTKFAVEWSIPTLTQVDVFDE